ncbi:MAG: histidine ammonia-lyase [Candidatus Krumholzibacteriota bacterium]
MSPSGNPAFVIGDQDLDLAMFMAVCRGRAAVRLGDTAREKIDECNEFRVKLAHSDQRIYGVNTGFGRLADTVIPPAQQVQLQKNLVRSHAVGSGSALSREEARGMILLRAMSLSHGFSGARVDVVEQLLWLLEADLHPWIPSRGSVGASGDLAPLSHLALVLMGEGHLVDEEGKKIDAGPVLDARGRKPLELEAKEGLALINGTQLMNSIGLLSVSRAKNLIGRATLAAALSLEALEGSALPFAQEYHRLRPHEDIEDVAACFRALLDGSEIMSAHHDCARVQDPYSLRCSPQVLGSSLGVARSAGEVFLREAHAVTDNPVLFPDRELVVTGGHFHGQPLAHQLDFLYQAVSEIANIAERRINLLLGGNGGRLPRFLAAEPGLESGLMIVQYLAAGLVTENKAKAFPAAVDSVPTSDGQEDHVSMGSVAALKLAGVLDRTETVVALEMLAASRALQFITREDLASRAGRQPLGLSAPLNALLAEIEKISRPDPADRSLSEDVERLSAWVRGGKLPAVTRAPLDSLKMDT